MGSSSTSKRLLRLAVVFAILAGGVLVWLRWQYQKIQVGRELAMAALSQPESPRDQFYRFYDFAQRFADVLGPRMRDDRHAWHRTISYELRRIQIEAPKLPGAPQYYKAMLYCIDEDHEGSKLTIPSTLDVTFVQEGQSFRQILAMRRAPQMGSNVIDGVPYEVTCETIDEAANAAATELWAINDDRNPDFTTFVH